MMRPLQTKVFPSTGSQQATALPMQSSTIPAQSTGGIDISELMNLMITMMIVVMMMKMMSGMMSGLA